MALLFRRNAPEAFAVVEIRPNGEADSLVNGLYETESAAKAMKTRAERYQLYRQPEARSTFEVVSVALEWESNHG
jgi:hypothetical protein